MSAPHVVVLGAGMGGLCAAIDAAAAGARVTVVERLERPGGKANIAEHDGVAFDTGPSVVTLPEVWRDLFHDADLDFSEAVEVLHPDPATRYGFPDGTLLDVMQDPAHTEAHIREAMGPEAAQEAMDFLAYSRRIWEAAAPHFVYGPAPTPGRLVRLAPVALTALPRIDPLRTMDGAIARQVSDPRLRDLFRRFATYNGSDPRHAPATLNCITHVELGLGIRGIRGGIHALIEALVQALHTLGGTLRLDTPADQVVTDDGQVSGLRLSTGEVLQADAVVCNADAAHLWRDLVDARTRRRLPRPAAPSMSGWVGVFKARRRPVQDRPAHTVWFPETYSAEFEDIFDRRRAPVDPTFYLCAQEKAHARPGWPDHEPLFVMANAPAEPEGEATPTEAWDRLRTLAHERLREADLIDADDTLVWERSPTELALTFPGTRGAIYGAASNDPLAAFRRPANRMKGVPGLYLASGSAHPGGGMPLCALSGRSAAAALLDDLADRGHPVRRPADRPSSRSS